MKKLNNKVALITGGSSGIGFATAKLFIDEGAFVFITGRRQVELNNAKEQLGQNAFAIQGDISNLSDLDTLISKIQTEKGSIDILVACAGVISVASTEHVTSNEFDKIFNVNVRGTFFTVQKALPIINKGGSVIILTSGMRNKGFADFPAYAATKAALRSLTKTWAADFAQRNIKINSVSPGVIETPFVGDMFKTQDETDAFTKIFNQMTPMKRLGRADEVATAMVFLASSDSSYMTGSDLAVDGGLGQI